MSEETEMGAFVPTNPFASPMFPEIELAYNLTPKDNPRVHPLCLCPKDSVIVAKKDAPFAPKHVWGSCPIEKCFRANGLDKDVDALRMGSMNVDGAVGGVVIPPFQIPAPDAMGRVPAQNQRSYGTYFSLHMNNQDRNTEAIRRV
jgi:hypothetical protein